MTRRIEASEAQTLRAVIDYLEAQQTLGNLVYLRIHPVRPFTDKFGSLKFAKVRESQKGAPDLIVWQWQHPNLCPKSTALEVKSKTGVQSEHQKTWEANFKSIGGRYVFARSVDEALEAVK